MGDRPAGRARRGRYLLTAVVAFVIGQLIIFGIGVPWLKVSTGLAWGTAVHEGFTNLHRGRVDQGRSGQCDTPTAWRLVRRSER